MRSRPRAAAARPLLVSPSTMLLLPALTLLLPLRGGGPAAAATTIPVIASAGGGEQAARTDDVEASTPLPAIIAVAGNGSSLAAAHILADHLRLLMGSARTVKVVSSAVVSAGMPHIAVGYEAARASGVPEGRLARADDDACIVSSVPPVAAGSVAIGAARGSLRGALNGIYELLRQLGVHTLAPNVTVLVGGPQPKQPPPVIPQGGWDIVLRPAFEEREVMADGVADCCCTCPATNVSGSLGFNGVHAHGPAGVHTHDEWQNKFAVGQQVAQATGTPIWVQVTELPFMIILASIAPLCSHIFVRDRPIVYSHGRQKCIPCNMQRALTFMYAYDDMQPTSSTCWHPTHFIHAGGPRTRAALLTSSAPRYSPRIRIGSCAATPRIGRWRSLWERRCTRARPSSSTCPGAHSRAGATQRSSRN